MAHRREKSSRNRPSPNAEKSFRPPNRAGRTPGLPRPASVLLRGILSREDAGRLDVDFSRIFREVREERGRLYAAFWLWGQIAVALPRLFHHRIYWSIQMLKNYILVAARNLIKHRLFSLVNIVGLTLGTACFILIGLFVRFELSYDGFNVHSDRVYRVIEEEERNGGRFMSAPTVLPLCPALRREFPEVEKAARIARRGGYLLSTGERSFYQTVYFADPELFDILTFSILEGDPAAALSRPNSLALTRTAAEKYFGREKALGRILTMDNRQDFTVTAILEDLPDNSHLRIQVLSSLESLRPWVGDRMTSWDERSNDYTYVLLREKTRPEDLEGRLPEFLIRNMGEEGGSKIRLHLQPLRDVHFTELAHDIVWTYSRTYLVAMSAIGLFILLIACFNFMNLATARSAARAREVGLRKVVGALRSQLMRQFLTESILAALISAAAAVGLVWVFLPWFRTFIGRGIEFDVFGDPLTPLVIFGIALLTGLVSGSYPALMLSAFQPIRTLGGRTAGGVRRLSLRTVFVMMQFAISTVLIVATLVVYRQLNYLRGRDLGFRSDQVIMIPLRESPFSRSAEALRARVARHPLVSGASVAGGTPGSGSSQTSNFWVQTPEGEKEVYLSYISTDYDFISTFGMTVVEGRDFSREFATDIEEAAVLNQTAARSMGWDSPIGKTIRRGGDGPRMRVIGVVKDFHYDSPQSRIEPMGILLRSNRPDYLAVRTNPADIRRLLPDLENLWKEGAPQYPFEYFFADQNFERSYRYDRKVGELFSVFALLAVVISCLGVFGLISYTVERAAKEIGIRKVLGASAAGIVLMLSRQFIRWVLAANLIAWPVAWLVMRRWLEAFAYRITPGPLEFLSAAGLALAVALATVFHQALRAALADPSRALRCE